jgi:hypothetical protein
VHCRRWKKETSDLHDGYDFENNSIAYLRLRMLGHVNISLNSILHISAIIQNCLHQQGIQLTTRHRTTRQQKACVFRWLDENWKMISLPLFDQVVNLVVGSPRRQQQNITFWSAFNMTGNR